MTLDPRGLSVVEWTERVNPFLYRYGPIPLLKEPSKWQNWAAAVIMLPGVSKFGPPNPYQFPDWMEWVDAFNRTVPSYL